MAQEELALSTGDEVIPRLKFGETGYNALKVAGGQVFEECSWELRWPWAVQTFKKMSKDGTIAPALNLVEMMIARVPWCVKVPEGYEEQLKDKAIFLRQNMDDMEHSWNSFIKEVVSFNRYGFDIQEKVYRSRYKSKGSKYNDGLVGIKKLPQRSQDSIVGWDWENDGRDLAACWQQVVKPSGLNQPSYDYGQDSVYGDKVRIPRKKFLLFRNGNSKDDPNGQSPLVGAWESWKYKKAFEESEAIGVSQDMQGFKVLYLPPRYMDPNASEEDKAVFEYYKKMMRNAAVAEQSGFILPNVVDENGNKFFEFDIVSVTGQKAFDTNAIINRYSLEILTCLFADFLSLGSNGSGSFSLAESKVSVIEMAIESKLIEIRDQLNHDLVPQLFSLNGWDTTVLPYFDFGKIAKQDLDVLSKYVQRLGAVGLVSQDAKTINWLAQEAGMPVPFDDHEIAIDEARTQLTGYTSGAAEGMQSGLNSGTGSANGSSGDTSVSNLQNKSTIAIVAEDEHFITALINGRETKFMREDFESLNGD